MATCYGCGHKTEDGSNAHPECDREERAKWERQHGVSSYTGKPLKTRPEPRYAGWEAEIGCLAPASEIL